MLKNVGVWIVTACTVSATVIKKLDASSAWFGVVRMALHCAQRAICCAVPIIVRINWPRVVVRNCMCSTCLKARKCRVVDCKDQRYSGEHGRLHKYCKKHHSRNTRCARCNVKGLKGGAKTFCLDCKEKIRKEWEWYFKKFKLLITF